MKKSLILPLAAMLLVLLSRPTYSVELNCKKLDAAACTAAFSAQFDEENKALYINGIKRVLLKVIAIFSGIVADAPTDDKFLEPIKAEIEWLNTKMQEFEEGQVDTKVLNDFLSGIPPTSHSNTENIKLDAKSEENYTQLFIKHGGDTMEQTFMDEHLLIYNKTSEIWFNLFDELRPGDVSNYAELQELNTMYKALEKTENNWKSMLYWGIIEKSVKALDLAFLKTLGKDEA